MRITFLFLIVTSLLAHGQTRIQPDAAKIKLDLKKLGRLGTVLYVAAHPDDENTRAIAFLVNDQLLTTGYLSMTRGDGGQNLIGPEIRDLLGLIRTQELMSARRIDGGQQFFTRANDFGFSKSAKETFEIWNKQEVLSDVVAVIRQFQPDVILTRFPPDERAGHGHHTASAILAQEAFDVIGDSSVFPDQVKEFGTWRVKRLYHNTGRFWNQSLTDTTAGVVTMNVGTYNRLLGESYSELAAESRTQHKSQGFGSAGRRGDAQEFFLFVKGEKAGKNILEGVNTSWTRVKGGEKVMPLVDKAIQEFKMENPSASVPILLEIRKAIARLEPGIWRTRKTQDVDNLIQNCLGLFVEVTADNYWVSPGERVTSSFEILNRSSVPVQLTAIHAPDLLFDTIASATLANNIPLLLKSRRLVRDTKPYSGPYWLKEPHGTGLFTVTDKKLIGKPENDPAVMLDFVFIVQGEPLTIKCPMIYKWTDPVKGELSRPFEVVPRVFVNLSDKVFVFPDQSPKQVTVVAKSSSEMKLTGSMSLSVPPGWKTEPAAAPFDLMKRGEEVSVVFKVFPGREEATGDIKAVAEVDGKKYDQSVQLIEYDHIPTQTLLPQAEAKVLRLDFAKEGSVVAYIKGAGDEIPARLKNMGYQVWEMKDEEVTPENLKKVDAVVLGIKALNTNDRIRHFMPDLLEYVKQGGTLVTQYNNNFGLAIDADKFSPYPLTLSRDRVSEENSQVRILKPDHRVLNYPNKITASDFDGWVQERGLYFPDKWDPHYEALLSINDVGEKPHDGSLLVASYGSGHYVYTGLSFFRQLPEGVPGAYKLFANIVSLGKDKKLAKAKVKPK